MTRIFVSSRRADSKIHGDNILDALEREFGKDKIIRNIDDVPFGVDFREFVYNQIAEFDFVLVIIGRMWSQVRDDYNRKMIENPADLVRLPVEMALKQAKMVIPVLVDQASMPVPAELPDTLHELCYRRPVEVLPGVAGQNDIKKLVNGLKQLATKNSGTTPPPAYQPPPTEQPPPPTPQPPPAPVEQAPPVKPVPPPQPVAPVEEAPIEPEPVEALPLEGVAKILPPPFDWVEITAGAVTLPAAVPGREQAVFIEAFKIAKFPVTNAQFQLFVEASDGYANRQWWDFADDARAWRQENPMPKKPLVTDAEMPRTNITWYEAVAFCNWLTSVMIRRDLDYVESLPGGRERFSLTLPTEAQWQRAAQGDDKRDYPWGNKFNPNLCNYGSSRLTRVTQFERGVGPFGVMDMVGNAAEWCLADFTTAATDWNAINRQKRRVLRGGGWGAAKPQDLRVTARLLLPPDLWNGSSGFRLVMT